MKCVSCWLYYLIILVYMAAVNYEVLTEAIVIIVTTLRHITLSETRTTVTAFFPLHGSLFSNHPSIVCYVF